MAASRLQRYAAFWSGYDFEIQYVKSEENPSDGLSRLPKITTEVEGDIDFPKLPFRV